MDGTAAQPTIKNLLTQLKPALQELLRANAQ